MGCKGDGGGPLVCPAKSNPGQYEQVGIVAWGLGCGEETPGVYADVTKALRFIDWATKCIDGTDKDYYGFGYGGRWVKHEYCEYTEKLNDYKKDVETSSFLQVVHLDFRPLPFDLRKGDVDYCS